MECKWSSWLWFSAVHKDTQILPKFRLWCLIVDQVFVRSAHFGATGFFRFTSNATLQWLMELIVATDGVKVLSCCKWHQQHEHTNRNIPIGRRHLGTFFNTCRSLNLDLFQHHTQFIPTYSYCNVPIETLIYRGFPSRSLIPPTWSLSGPPGRGQLVLPELFDAATLCLHPLARGPVGEWCECLTGGLLKRLRKKRPSPSAPKDWQAATELAQGEAETSWCTCTMHIALVLLVLVQFFSYLSHAASLAGGTVATLISVGAAFSVDKLELPRTKC